MCQHDLSDKRYFVESGGSDNNTYIVCDVCGESEIVKNGEKVIG